MFDPRQFLRRHRRCTLLAPLALTLLAMIPAALWPQTPLFPLVLFAALAEILLLFTYGWFALLDAHHKIQGIQRELRREAVRRAATEEASRVDVMWAMLSREELSDR